MSQAQERLHGEAEACKWKVNERENGSVRSYDRMDLKRIQQKRRCCLTAYDLEQQMGRHKGG